MCVQSTKQHKTTQNTEEQEMKKKDAKEIARDILQDALAVAYYKLDEDSYSEEEQDLISECLRKEAERMLKLVNREYITY